ncbi:MAG TPA: arsenosugar biosynthesis radical SAM (seleno)protein ArsS [Thermodesulfobacteriota bacterium]|nr:arsenosugar biosynthesis radical SAM (seleno)protein ArsS [Thermodesulfobacteriota bacterium]
MNDFERRVSGRDGNGLQSRGIDILQVNVGLMCNQECRHCHLECSPRRPERMEWETMKAVLHSASDIRPALIDLTGGAPELNPFFGKFVDAFASANLPVQVRTNLTALAEKEGLPEFLRDRRVGLVGSMPCYMEENVRAQRGRGVYERSVAAIRMLNSIGYGVEPDLPLALVYNPGGAFLPPSQAELEEDYRRELWDRFQIRFTRLLTIANLPLGRFLRDLEEKGETRAYLRLLRESFNPLTVEKLMCRHQISVRWDGTLFDCDFNLALGLAVNHGAPDHIRSFRKEALLHRRIVTGEHCFGCTAGAGSSCGGALV